MREQRVLKSCDSHMNTVSLTLDSSAETKANMVELITNLSGVLLNVFKARLFYSSLGLKYACLKIKFYKLYWPRSQYSKYSWCISHASDRSIYSTEGSHHSTKISQIWGLYYIFSLVPRVCLVGLHCCGDLTPVLLRLLATPTHPALTSAVIVSCCYHKMATVCSASDESMFENFPLSQSLRRAMSCNEGCGSATPFLNAFALRLAAQESYERYTIFISMTPCMHVLVIVII